MPKIIKQRNIFSVLDEILRELQKEKLLLSACSFGPIQLRWAVFIAECFLELLRKLQKR